MSPIERAGQGVRALLSAMIEVRGLHQAAYLLALFALLSQLLALVRDRLFASTFGVGELLDVYYAAFRVPDLLFATVASLLSLYALLPVLARLEERHPGSMTPFMERVLLVFFVVVGAAAALLYVLAPALAALVAPGLPQESLTTLMRILLLQPILLGASNILAALTQLRHRFLIYALSPLLYNLGIIFGVLFLYPSMGPAGLAWGVVFGALLHLLIQLPLFLRERRGRITPTETGESVQQVLMLSAPRTLALAMGQLTLLILTALASYLTPGSIAVFTFAFNLQTVPLAIIGVSYSVAAFPVLSKLFAAGDRAEFLRHIEAALRHMLFWAIPATVLVIVLRAQLVRTILGAGAFDWDATRLTAAALALFIVSLCAQSVSLLVSRAYYAAGRSARPLIFAVAAVVVSVVSAFVLTAAFHASPLWRGFLESLLRVADIPGTTVLMLALGYCLGALVQAALALFAFSREFPLNLGALRRLSFESFASAILGGTAAYAMLAFLGQYLNLDTALGVMLQGLLAGITGLCVTALCLLLLGNPEIKEAYAALHKRFIKAPPAVEATEVA